MSPSLSKSTPATEKLVGGCLADLMPIILEKRVRNRNLELGDFELALRQPQWKQMMNVM